MQPYQLTARQRSDLGKASYSLSVALNDIERARRAGVDPEQVEALQAHHDRIKAALEGLQREFGQPPGR